MVAYSKAKTPKFGLGERLGFSRFDGSDDMEKRHRIRKLNHEFSDVVLAVIEIVKCTC